jgi:capsular polysaccharide biosynthesis protein
LIVDLHHYLALVRARWTRVLVVVVAAIAIAWSLTPSTARYRATSTIYVGSRVVDLKNAADVQYGQIATLDRFIETFARMIDSEQIAALATQQARLQRSAAEVVSATTAHQIKNTQLLAIDVSDPDPATAQKLANALADAFLLQVQDLEGTGRAKDAATNPAPEGSVPNLPAYIFEHARLPVTPEPTSLAFNLAVAALLGLVIGIGAVVILDYMDITLRGIEDAERRLELPVLGSIPDQNRASPARTREPVRARVAS